MLSEMDSEMYFQVLGSHTQTIISGSALGEITVLGCVFERTSTGALEN